MTKQYYIHRCGCKAHNKKTEALADYLRTLNFTLVSFTSSFGLQEFASQIKDKVADLNVRYHHGNDLTVTVSDFGAVTIAFSDKPNGEAVATIMLYPVKFTIGEDTRLIDFI